MSLTPKDEFIEVGPSEGQEGTRLESVEEIRKATQAQRIPTSKDAGVPADTLPYRPVRQLPIGLLGILDPGREDGEWVRLRSDKTVIGRTEGDIVIQQETMMSSRHAEISRLNDKGRFRWILTDLQSTNGTFVRIGNALLKHGQEFLIGGRRYRFDAAQKDAALLSAVTADEGKQKGTQGWQSVTPTDLLPSLVELKPQGEGTRVLLTKPENWIGRDGTHCSVVFSDDLLVSPRHARLYRDSKGRWHIENAGSRNGTWLRVNKFPIDSFCQFQLGEQRFLLRVL